MQGIPAVKTSSEERFWFLRRPVQFLADLIILSAAFFLAYLPSVNVQLGEFYFETAIIQLPFVVLVQFSSLFLVGAYAIIWRYVSLEDLKAFLKAALISGVILLSLRFLLSFAYFSYWQVPISVILIDTILAFGGILGHLPGSNREVVPPISLIAIRFPLKDGFRGSAGLQTVCKFCSR